MNMEAGMFRDGHERVRFLAHDHLLLDTFNTIFVGSSPKVFSKTAELDSLPVQLKLTDPKEIVRHAPMDRPVGFGKPNPPLPQSAPDPSQEHFLRASDQHRRASQSQKRRDRPSSTKLFFEPTSPLRHRRQPEALSNAV